MAKLSKVVVLTTLATPVLALAQASTRIDVDWNYTDSSGIPNTGSHHTLGDSDASFEQDTRGPGLSKGITNNGIAKAGDGTVGAFAHAELGNPDYQLQNFSYNQTAAIARLSSTDLAISGPSDLAFINTKLRFTLDGHKDAKGGRLYVNVASSQSAQLVINVADGSVYYDSSGIPTFSTHGVEEIHLKDLGGGMEQVDFAVPERLFANGLNTALISMTAIANATKTSTSGQEIEQTVDFLNTLSFSTSGPALDLPTGYTSNSETFHIVNNQYQAVPEPGSLALMGGALALMLFKKRAN